MTTIGWRELAAALVGGMVGSGLRLAIDLAFPNDAAQFPWATLAINVVGSFILGACVSALWQRASAWLRAGLGAGVLGAFTTFSAVMGSAVALSASGQWMLAACYLVASVALGIAAAAFGLRLRRLNTTIGVDE